MYFILQNIVNSKFVEIFVKIFYKLYREYFFYDLEDIKVR